MVKICRPGQQQLFTYWRHSLWIMKAQEATLIELCTCWQLHCMQNCAVLGFHFHMWKHCVCRSNGRLIPRAAKCGELTAICAISSFSRGNSWFHVTQGYVHVFIFPLTVLRTVAASLMGNEKIAKILALHVIPNGVPKSKRRISSVVTCGFEDSAVRFWSPLHGLEKLSINK